MHRILSWSIQFILLLQVAQDYSNASVQGCIFIRQTDTFKNLRTKCGNQGYYLKLFGGKEPAQSFVDGRTQDLCSVQELVPLEEQCGHQALCGLPGGDPGFAGELKALCRKKNVSQHQEPCKSLQYVLERHCFGSCWGQCNTSEFEEAISKAKCCMEVFEIILKRDSHNDIVHAIRGIETVLEETKVNETTSMFVDNVIAVLHKPTGVFKGLEIHANENEAKINVKVPYSKVTAGLPRELEAGENNTIVFCMIHLPNETALNNSDKLYDHRLIGLSVRGRNVSELQERVNITLTLNTSTTKTHKPQCVFLDTSTRDFRSDGCLTLWEQNQTHVTCSCNHLTYFGVLLVSVPEGSLSPVDQKILSYITIVGCSISLFGLLLTVLIFITNRKLREDDSKKIHISLSVALILLNLHFLPSEAVAASSLHGFCLYMALGLHYSLLATFSWMALEGLHLYLLLVKVFNIYIRRYLLKLSLVGWGVPAVIVSVVVIIDKDYYGHAPLDESYSPGSGICYITNSKVKMVTTVGVFSLVFLFNVIMFGVIVRWFVSAHFSRVAGQSSRNAVKREICTLLSVMVLLGITWGLNFFLYGSLTTPGLYAFCILNSLQGIFIFIYFVLSLGKTKDSSDMQSIVTHTSSISAKI